MSNGKKRYTAKYLRKCVWRCFDIAASEVTIPLLISGIEGIGYDTAKKALRQLEIHGYVVKAGQKGKGPQLYARSRKTALLPDACERCGAGFEAKTCEPSFKKEREKEREKEKKSPRATRADADAAISRGIKELTFERTGNPSDRPDWHTVPEGVKDRLERYINEHEGRTPEEVTHDAA